MKETGRVIIKGINERIKETHSKERAIRRESTSQTTRIICNPHSTNPLAKFIVLIDRITSGN
ncbi:MAG: hypothetical protein ACUVXA_06835 [Candidatus Jordarchaeum sp.]|uniref:hypothetical protein n=1 Tax=Candidatus Jordarchaeum sp. TaxID=2823881 RepID=UPI00404B506A